MSFSIDTEPGSPLEAGHATAAAVWIWQEYDHVAFCLLASYEFPSELADDEHWTQADEGDGHATPFLTVTGGMITAFADPPMIEPPGDGLSPEIAFGPQIDMENLEWVALGIPEEVTMTLPSVTRYVAEEGSVGDDGMAPPAIAWVTGCAAVDTEPFTREGIASSTFLYQWGRAEQVWDSDSSNAKVTIAYEPNPSASISEVAPPADETIAYRLQHEFDFNSVSTSRVTYVSAPLQALALASRWIALAAATALIADFFLRGRPRAE